MKRNIALQPLSRDHHHALLLCWKISLGFTKGVETVRVKRYANWFYETYLTKHFALEEEHLFPILGGEHPLIQQAITEHRQLTMLFKDEENLSHALTQIHSLLQAHIRFEERNLFNEIQRVATPEQLKLYRQIHVEGPFVDNLQDAFWAAEEQPRLKNDT